MIHSDIGMGWVRQVIENLHVLHQLPLMYQSIYFGHYMQGEDLLI